jgi:hypothetical protein
MKTTEYKGEMSTCDNCFTRVTEVIINVGELRHFELCNQCRKELMKQLIDKF